MSFTVLSVCTGNVCRSPLAELMIADGLRSITSVHVFSAGTGALVGSGVPAPTARLAERLGLNASQHTSQQIDVEMIRRSDLIIGMAREHRRRVVEFTPAAMRRTFTLRELARVADAVKPELPQAVGASGAATPDDAMRAAIALAAAMRGTVAPPVNPADFDVVDPYRQSDAVYEQSLAELAPAARAVSDFLATAVSSIPTR